MGKIYFIADCHFSHKNVIRFDKRHFETVEDMDEKLIANWNSVVKPGDVVYILGDFCWLTENRWKEILSRLKGNKVLIKGNHDIKHMSVNLRKQFQAIKDYDDIVVTLKDGTKQRVILSHYYIPFFNGHRYGAVLLHGHSHITEEANIEREITQILKDKGFNPQIYNIGCMHSYMNYTPQTLDSIMEGYKQYEKNIQK